MHVYVSVGVTNICVHMLYLPGLDSNGTRDMFAELRIMGVDDWNESTDVAEKSGRSCSWHTRLTGLVDLREPDKRRLRLQAKILCDGKEQLLVGADIGTAVIKDGEGQWVEVTGKTIDANGNESGEYSISARFRKGESDLWEDAPATPTQLPVQQDEREDAGSNYGESIFGNNDLGSTTQSTKATVESDGDYGDDFEGNSSKVLPEESAGDNEYDDEEYEDDYADDDFADDEEE